MVNIAVIPCKSISQRVPGKNFLDLQGKPLWKHTVDFLLSLEIFDHIIISTDKPELFPRLANSSINIHYRADPRLISSHAFVVVEEVLSHFFKTLTQDSVICMALPTSPFRRKTAYMTAYSMLINGADSVIGVKRCSTLASSHRIIDHATHQLLPLIDRSPHVQSTDIEEYQVTGSLFMARLSSLLSYKTFHVENAKGILLDDYESFDINRPIDYEFAKYIAANLSIS
jgi:CMP-N,N'-diacetyllegionaminic acid synthase